jgi:hypothetical protein
MASVAHQSLVGATEPEATVPGKKAGDRDVVVLDLPGSTVAPPTGAPSRLRHLRHGNPALNRDRRPPAETRIRRGVELVLGEQVGGLVNDLLDQARRGKLPPHVARVMLDRLLPPAPPRAVDLGLPLIRTARDLLAATDLILAAVNEGRVTPGEARELQAVVREAWLTGFDVEAAVARCPRRR